MLDPKQFKNTINNIPKKTKENQIQAKELRAIQRRNWEQMTERGKQKQGPEASGGGNFAERTWSGKGGNGNGNEIPGKGLGDQNPNPHNFCYLHNGPQKFIKLLQTPYSLHERSPIYDELYIDPQFIDYCEKPPDNLKVVQVSPISLKKSF